MNERIWDKFLTERDQRGVMYEPALTLFAMTSRTRLGHAPRRLARTGKPANVLTTAIRPRADRFRLGHPSSRVTVTPG